MPAQALRRPVDFEGIGSERLRQPLHLHLVPNVPEQVVLTEIPDTVPEREKHGASLLLKRKLGALSSGQCVDRIAYEALESEDRTDFKTAVQEGLATDEEYGDTLTFEPARSHSIIDGHVCDNTGRRMIDLVRRGAEISRAKAVNDSRYLVQAERDEADIPVAEIVDDLAVGESYTAVSMDPKEAIARDGKEFWEGEMHYREGMAIVQSYYRVDEHTVLTWTYSLKRSDIGRLTNVMRRHGAAVPDGVRDNEFICYGIRKSATYEEARLMAPSIRRDFRAEMGDRGQQVSVTELMAANKDKVDAFYKTYGGALNVAAFSGRSNEILRGLAGAIVQRPSDRLKPEVMTRLRYLKDADILGDDDVRLLNELVIYATIEELRGDIKFLLGGDKQAGYAHIVARAAEFRTLSAGQLHQVMAYNVKTGADAGRTYGGCAGAGSMIGGIGRIAGGPQDAFGGKADGEGGEEDGACDYFIDQCLCSPFEEDGSLAARRHTVRVVSDNGNAECQRCHACMNDKGEITDQGTIYPRAENYGKKDDNQASSKVRRKIGNVVWGDFGPEQSEETAAESQMESTAVDDAGGQDADVVAAYPEGTVGAEGADQVENLTGKVLLFAR